MAVLVEEGLRGLRITSRGLDWERSRVVMEACDCPIMIISKVKPLSRRDETGKEE